MDRQTLWRFADACQVVAGRVEEEPGASADLMRDLLARAPGAADARVQAVIDGLAARMLSRARLVTTAIAPPAGELTTVDSGLDHFKIADVLAYLEQQFANPSIRLSSAARYAALSPAYLARLLRASTGLTFRQHLRRFRVQSAERLLLTTMLSIKEVAGQCGYSASGSFARDFRRMHGCTPSAWRARRRIPQLPN